MTSPPLPDEQLLKPETVARWLQCSKAVVYSEAKKKNLSCIVVAGKLIRFERRAIENYIKARRRSE